MPEFNRTTWSSERWLVYRFVGNEQHAAVFSARSRTQAQEVSSLLRGAYQKGREELMAELAELAQEHGGLELLGRQLLEADKPQNCATEYPHPRHNWQRGATVRFRCPGVQHDQVRNDKLYDAPNDPLTHDEPDPDNPTWNEMDDESYRNRHDEPDDPGYTGDGTYADNH